MANGMDPTSAPDDVGGGAPPPQPPGGGGPPDGGPLIASLAQRQNQPQVSAPGMGDQAASMTLVAQALGMLEKALPGLGAGSKQHTEVSRMIHGMSRMVGRTQPTLGVQKTNMMDQMQQLGKNALLFQLMQQQQQKGGQPDQGGPAGPSPIPGASAQAPMPSTPLPGA